MNFSRFKRGPRKAKKQPKPLTPEKWMAVSAWRSMMQADRSCMFNSVKLDVAANLREHFMARKRRVEIERCYGSSFVTFYKPVLPCVVTFTRYSPRMVDDDGLPSCFKGVRDGIAKAMLTHDGPGGPIKWEYDQKKSPPHCYGFTVMWRAVPV